MITIPPHWWFAGPSRPRPASDLFRQTHVPGAHASTYRRLIRVGPWSISLLRYRPGDDPTVTTIPTSDRPAVVRRTGTGRCGAQPGVTPWTTGKPQPICALPAGHAGWHRSDDGCEWGIPTTNRC